MRGDDEQQASVWSYIPLEQRVPADHPLRALRAMIDEALRELSPQFSQLYAKVGRPSIAPERLLRALLLQVLYSVRSERLLMEQLDYNLLFRWFVGLSADDPIWDATVFTKNRQRLLEGDIARAFFDRVVAQARHQLRLDCGDAPADVFCIAECPKVAFGVTVNLQVLIERFASAAPHTRLVTERLQLRDCAAAGEQITTRKRLSRRAACTSSVRSAPAGRSSRSRKIGVRRAGTAPSAVSLPTSLRGTRYDSSRRWSHRPQRWSAWL